MLFKKNIDITNLSNFKTPAKAKYFYEFNGDLLELLEVLKFSKKNSLKILPISGGTNILFAFDVFDGIIIKFNPFKLGIENYNIEIDSVFDKKIKAKFFYENGILRLNAFERISSVAEILYKNRINDLWIRFIGLPGTIAGAVVGNAGCFGLEIENNLIEIKALNLDTLEFEILKKENLNYSYRNSLLKKTGNYLVLEASFDLSKKVEKYSYSGTLEDIINFRKNKQPYGNTCGSFFQNPSKKYPAGKLIELVGLKGYKLGGAFFSQKHANFLMSDGTATWEDLISLKNLAQKKIKEKFNIDLIPEVRIIYNS